MTQHKYSEAFMLMQYEDTKTGAIEWIWNSRDGITPFCISSREGNEARHVRWQEDRFAPYHEPSIGDRIFDGQTLDECRAGRRSFVEKHRALVEEHYPGEPLDQVIESLAQADYNQYECPPPTIRVVTPEVSAMLRRRRGLPDRPVRAG